MNLIDALWHAGYCFTLTADPAAHESTPGLVPARRMTLTLTAPNKKALTEDVRAFHYDLEAMMAFLLRKQSPDNPVYRQWLSERKGQHPVRLVRGALQSLGECVHTALRKLADSTSSSLTWNALHRMSEEDCAAIYQAIRVTLRTQFKDKGRLPLRCDLAQSLKQSVKDAVSERTLDLARQNNERGLPRTRTPEQAYALRMFDIGVDATDASEWMYSWLGYVVETAPVTPSRQTRTAKSAAKRPAKRARAAARRVPAARKRVAMPR